MEEVVSSWKNKAMVQNVALMAKVAVANPKGARCEGFTNLAGPDQLTSGMISPATYNTVLASKHDDKCIVGSVLVFLIFFERILIA